MTIVPDDLELIPVVRSERYPRHGDAALELLGVTCFEVGIDFVEVGRVTLRGAAAHVGDCPGSIEFDLSPAAAVRLAGLLMAAAARAYQDPSRV